MDEAEEHKELCPGAEALVHSVRVESRVFAQAPVEAGERVVADEGLVLRQHAALFGVEQKDEAQDDGEQAAVDVVAVAFGGERFAEQVSAGSVVGGLEPAHELVERVQHLLGKAFAHLVLVLAAVLEERREPLVAGQCEEALLGEEQTKSGAQGAPRGTGHVGDAKVHPARAFAARGGDEPERDAVEEQARGDAGATKQALRSPVGRSFEPSTRATARWRVEVPPHVQNLNQKLPRLPPRHAGRVHGPRSPGATSRRSPGAEAPAPPESGIPQCRRSPGMR